MELHQLATFQAVAKTLSFTQAAAALNYEVHGLDQFQALERSWG